MNTHNYHTRPISDMANTLSAILEVRDVFGTEELEEIVRFAYRGEGDHVVLFCPSALGTEAMRHYAEAADKVKQVAPLVQDFVVPHPAGSATSYASMFAGVPLAKGDIPHGAPIAKPSLFGECKGKRRVGVFMPDAHPCRELWTDTGIEIETARTDMDVVSKAVEAIRKDCYDLIVVFVDEFLQMIRSGKLYGKRADAAVEHHVTEFELLVDAASVYMRGNTFVGFCPDHGCHKDMMGGGAFHSHRAEDLNVTHYFGVVSSLKREY